MEIAKIIRFSIMMFFQYMVWGLWFIYVEPYLVHLGFTGVQIGGIFGVFFLASLISPFIGGQIADRYLPTQAFLGIVHILGGFMLIYISTIQDFTLLWWMMFLYSILYAPTLALTNSICFHHLKNKDRDFGIIRSFGTSGWIAAGLLLTAWWFYIEPMGITWEEIGKLSGDEKARQTADFIAKESRLFSLGGVVSLILGLYCFTLPHTPPAKEGTHPLAFLEALKLCKNKNFAFFLVLSFVVSTELMFYYGLTSNFLLTMMPAKWVPACTTLAQLGELFTLLLILPFALTRLGIRKTIAIGIIAWPIRYAIFSIGEPTWLIVSALPLHGICYVFFFIAGQIFVDKVAPADIRASAQSLYFQVTFGLGLFMGSYLVGWVKDFFTDPQTEVIHYTGLFLVPCVLTILCAIVFFLFFRDPEETKEESAET